FALFGLATLVLACDAITSIAVDGADFGGATSDAHCDRRFVGDAGQPSAFCQEIVDTVAASQFADDCRTKFAATAGPGRCPRDRVIAGCALDKKDDDGSHVWDWYYDVSNLVPDGGPDASDDAASYFAMPIPHRVSDVASVCADPGRYEDGAELALP